MEEFLGIKNVVDAEAILGTDGAADGFKISYYITRNGKRIMKTVTKYVREFDPNSVKNDGLLHGFGKGTVYLRSSHLGASKDKKKVVMTSSGLSHITKILKK